MLDGITTKDERGIKLYYPPIALCTGQSILCNDGYETDGIDNAAMIAWTAILRIQGGMNGEGYGLGVRAKWSLEDLYDDGDGV